MGRGGRTNWPFGRLAPCCSARIQRPTNQFCSRNRSPQSSEQTWNNSSRWNHPVGSPRLTSDPPLDQITDHTIASFIANLCKQPGRRGTMMMSSVAKLCRNVDTVLQMAGPRSRHNRRGQGLIGEPPFFDAPRVDQEPPSGDWTIEEIRAMYSATDRMTELSRLE